MIRVNPLKEIIPKHKLLKLLEDEAPDFMTETLRLEIPESNDRLILPVINTEEKIAMQDRNTNPLHVFMSENYYYCPGKIIRLSDLHEKFNNWLLDNNYNLTELDAWSAQKISKELPSPYIKGRSNTLANAVCIANISDVKPNDNDPQLRRLVLKENGRLYVEGE